MKRHIRKSEVYLTKHGGELLYNVIAVYIITVLIKTSLESQYNLLVVGAYLLISTIFSQQFSNFMYSRLKQYVEHILLGHIYIVPNCSKTRSVHCCLLYAIIIIAPICRKLTIIYRQLGYNHLIYLLWVFFLFIEAGNYVSNIRFYNIILLLTQPLCKC